MIKKNIKLIIGFVIGIILPSVAVYGLNTLSASSISIDKTNMASVPDSNLQSALDYLYSKSKINNMITIESRVEHKYQTYLGIAYLDPTDLTKKCTEADEKSNRNNDENHTITGVKSGCMKWYIFKDNGTSYSAILDHNTTATVKYNGDNDNSIQKEIAQALTTDTAGWGTKGDEVIDLSPRLITADEVAEITGANIQISWDSIKTASGWFCLDSNQPESNTLCAKAVGTSNYAWLFDNTWGCTNQGCNTADSSNWGYWTETPAAESESNVWLMVWRGYLSNDVASNPGFGLRPVITFPKSLFNS